MSVEGDRIFRRTVRVAEPFLVHRAAGMERATRRQVQQAGEAVAEVETRVGERRRAGYQVRTERVDFNEPPF